VQQLSKILNLFEFAYVQAA